jgi:hypothetical protein
LKKQKATGYTYCQANNIKQGKPFSFCQVAKSSAQVVFEHVTRYFLGETNR